LRIVYLLETAEEPWGGVQTVLRDARALRERGHQVLLVSRSGPPAWTDPGVPFLQDPALSLEGVDGADLVVGTYWSTVPAAVLSGKGIPVHFCQGFEGNEGLPARIREAIERVYAMEETSLVVVSSHLADLLGRRFGRSCRTVPNAVDGRVMHPGPPRGEEGPLRVGLFGPAQVPIKGIAAGIEACLLAARAGLDLVLVRASHLPFLEAEFKVPFRVEAHCRVPYEEMGNLYRSLDLFLGTADSVEEGFYLPGLEALACGVPSVLTDIPSIRSYAKGNSALLVPPGDREAMAAALVFLARRRDVRETLRRGAVQAAASFTMEDRLELLERTFLEILEERRGRSLSGAGLGERVSC